MWEVCCYDTKFPSVNVDVDVGDALVDCVEPLDTAGYGLVDEKSNSTCVRVVTRAGKYMQLGFSGPKFAGVRAPSFVDCDDVP